MKKIFLLVMAGTTSCAFAQKSFFGANAGINIANQRMVSTNTLFNGYTTSVIEFAYSATKPTFGVFYQRSLSDLMDLRLTAQYMGMGYNEKGNSGPSVTINYLTFPLALHLMASRHFIISTGAYLSFTLGGTRINNEDITKTYHKNDFGLSLGGEHDLYKNFALGVNYYIGLKNIWLNDTTPIFAGTTTTKYTNRALQFTLIYKFRKTG